MDALPQHIVLRLLSDDRLRPIALQLRPAEPVGEAFAALLAGPALAALVADFPCVVAAEDAARLPPPQRDALATTGCRFLAPGAILAADSLPEAGLPPGAGYLAGDADLQPPAKAAAGKTGSRTQALRLMQLVAADAGTLEIEEIFRSDPTLSYHLLRLVNSPGVGVGRQISSFAQAILILGRKQLRRWLNLLLFAAGKDDPRSPMLMARAALRGRGMELLAKEVGLDRETQELAFMAGMFSLLGVMFGMPLADVLQPLRLDPSLSAALLQRDGDLGRLLAGIEAAERGDGEALRACLDGFPARVADIDQLWLEAHRWMLELLRQGEEGGHA